MSGKTQDSVYEQYPYPSIIKIIPLEEDDIQTIMSVASVTRQKAIDTILKIGDSVVDCILYLQE